MSTRKLLLIFVPAAALLIFALLREVRDGESVAGSVASHVLDGNRQNEPGGATLLPTGAGSAGSRVEALPVGDAGAAAAAQALAPALGTVSGKVVDAAGHAIAGEPVFLTFTHDDWDPHKNPHDDDDDQPEPVVGSAVSDADGGFSFPARSGVQHTLHAGGGKWPRVAEENVHAGDRLVMTLPDGFVLTGTVVEAETHEPVVNASVLALADDNHLLGTTGRDGSFSLGPLPAQDVIVGAYAPGFDVSLKTEIAPALGPVALELPPGRAVRGRIVDRDTTSVIAAGGEITLQMDVLASLAGGKDKLPGNRLVEEQKATVDARGTFSFTTGPSYGFSLLASVPGYAPTVYDRYEHRTLGPDDDIAINLKALVPLAGKVVVADGGTAAAGVSVSARNPKAEFAAGKTDGDGSFTLDPKDWDGHDPVYVAAQDEQGRAGRVRVDDSKDPLLVQLVAPLSVRVRVTAGGEPVPGAEVAALSDDSDATLVLTGTDGTAALVHPLAGPDVQMVRLQARNGDAQSLPLLIDPRQPHADTVVLALDGGGSVSGLVLDRAGNVVPSAQIRLFPDAKLSPDMGQQMVKLGYIESSVDYGNKAPAPPGFVHSDQQGKFRVPGVVPDVAYTLKVRAEGFREGVVSPAFADPAPLTVTLDPVVLWQGRLVDAGSGLPMQSFVGQLLQEVKVGDGLAFRPTKQRVARKPDAPGEFSVELPAAGRFELKLMAQDFVTVTSPAVDFDGLRAPPFAALAIFQAAVLEVTIQDGLGRAVSGYLVAVIPAAAAEGADTPSGDARKQATQLRTDEKGTARFNLGEGGSYRVAAGPALWLDSQNVDVKPGTPASRTYHLPPTGDLEITINDELGRPLPGVRAEVRSAKDEKDQSIVRTAGTHGVDGTVGVDTLPPGNYDVFLYRRGYDPERRTGVPVAGNEINRLTIAMSPKSPDQPQGAQGNKAAAASGQFVKKPH